MNLMIVGPIGAAIGFLATLLLRSRQWRRFLANGVIGFAGGALVAWFLSPLAGLATPDALTTPEIVGALLGSVFWVALFTLVLPPRP